MKKSERLKPRKSWSYSQWSNYHSCPAKYKFANVMKLPQPQSPAAERGNNIHKKAEQYLLGKGKSIPDELKNFENSIPGKFEYLRELEIIPEEKWGITEDWKETEWVADDTWLRAITDAHGYNYEDELLVIDFKTGRKYAGHKDQESLYATAAMELYPEAEVARVEFWYLDQGEIVSTLYHRKRTTALRKEWTAFANRTLTDPICAPLPSFDSCRWCPFKKENGGPCPY